MMVRIRCSSRAPRLLLLLVGCVALLGSLAIATAGDDAESRASTGAEGAGSSRFTTVSGGVVDFGELKESRFVVFFFSLRMSDLVESMRCFQTAHEEGAERNARVVGVSIDRGSASSVRAFLEAHNFTFPVVVDEQGVIAQTYRPRSFPHSYFFSLGWRSTGELPGFPDATTTDRGAVFTNLVRKNLGLPQVLPADPLREFAPLLPEFQVAGEDGVLRPGTELLGDATIITFVAEDCPYCAQQLQFFRSLHAEHGADGLEVLAILVDPKIDPETFRAERNLPFAVIPDRDRAIRTALGYRGVVPDNFVVDRGGRVRYRHTRYDVDEPALYTMEVRNLLDLENPPILRRSEPSGQRRCLVCHEEEYFHWGLTAHSNAMETLQKIGEDENPECLPCHVVGWGEPGGYDSGRGERTHDLRDVQCESCHGIGGGHLAEREKVLPQETCASCHDEKHSLMFDPAKAWPLVVHDLSEGWQDPDTHAKLAELWSKRKEELLQPSGAFVGSEQCAECHSEQFDSWSTSSHGAAGKPLDRVPPAKHAADPEDCASCHTTGFGRLWDLEVEETSREGVGCESCHGPGERHVAAVSDEERRRSIIGLGEKCERCVVEQVCTACHDAENDADFSLDEALPKASAMCKPRGKE